MIKSFFSTLSYIFHPLFLPTIGLYLLFNLPSTSPGLIDLSLYGIDPDLKKGVYQIFITLLVVAPGLSILIMVWSGMIKSIKMETQEERTYAISVMLIYTIFCYVYLRYLIISSSNYDYLLIYLFAITLTLLVSFILNFYVKISLHAIGIFGVAGALIGYFNNQMNFNIYVLLSILFIGGLICSGRLFLKAHKSGEVLLGMAVGFAIEFLCMKFEWFI